MQKKGKKNKKRNIWYKTDKERKQKTGKKNIRKRQTKKVTEGERECIRQGKKDKGDGQKKMY